MLERLENLYVREGDEEACSAQTFCEVDELRSFQQLLISNGI